MHRTMQVIFGKRSDCPLPKSLNGKFDALPPIEVIGLFKNAFFPCDLVPQLILASEGMKVPLALAATKEPNGVSMRQPTFGLWPVALREDLRGHLQNGLRKIVQWTEMHGARQAEFSSTPFDPFFNVNTPQDLETASALLKDHA